MAIQVITSKITHVHLIFNQTTVYIRTVLHAQETKVQKWVS